MDTMRKILTVTYLIIGIGLFVYFALPVLESQDTQAIQEKNNITTIDSSEDDYVTSLDKSKEVRTAIVLLAIFTTGAIAIWTKKRYLLNIATIAFLLMFWGKNQLYIIRYWPVLILFYAIPYRLIYVNSKRS